jgi:hypothetical protein
MDRDLGLCIKAGSPESRFLHCKAPYPGSNPGAASNVTSRDIGDTRATTFIMVGW